MERITEGQLVQMVKRINTITGSSQYTYEGGKSNVGNFHLDGAYGGWKLSRITNEAGGCTDVFQNGFMTKRELANMLDAYIRGLNFHQQIEG